MLRLRFRSPRPKERDPNPRRLPGKPDRQRSRMLEACDACAVSGVGRSRRPSLCAAKNDGAAREHCRNELHLNPGRSLGTGASSTL